MSCADLQNESYISLFPCPSSPCVGTSLADRYVSSRQYLRRAFNQRGVSASQYVAARAAVTAGNRGGYWNQASDRTMPHRGGVDVKHGSYSRYLSKLTCGAYRETKHKKFPIQCGKDRGVTFTHIAEKCIPTNIKLDAD